MSLGRLPTYSLCLDCEGATRSCAPPAGARQPRRTSRADAGRGWGSLGSASADPRRRHDHPLAQHWLLEQQCEAGSSAVRSTQPSSAKNMAEQRSKRRAPVRSTQLVPRSSARARPSARNTRPAERCRRGVQPCVAGAAGAAGAHRLPREVRQLAPAQLGQRRRGRLLCLVLDEAEPAPGPPLHRAPPLWGVQPLRAAVASVCTASLSGCAKPPASHCTTPYSA